ncbi:MAG TPA: tetratricopeptide repeat protein [bacterium]|nr:tetratricopeptide repeat protein [bacterium]
MGTGRLVTGGLVALLLCGAGCATSRVTTKTPNPGKGHNPSYNYLLSELEIRKNNPAKALVYIEEALRKDPGAARLWYKKAFLEAAMGDLPKAETDVQQSLSIDAADRDANILMGKICQAQDRHPCATASYKKALAADPASEDANTLLIETHVAAKQYRPALAQSIAWQREDPENILPVFYEAWIAQNFLKDPARAINAYQRVVEMDPSNAKALSALAELYVARKDDARALEAFTRLEALAPNDVNLKLKVALIYYEQKQFEKAVEKFQELKAAYPDDDRLGYYMGVIQENLKKDDEAAAEFEKVAVSSQFYKDARLHLAFLKLRQKDEAGAVRIMEDAIRKKPRVGPFYEYLSEIYRDRPDYDRAIEVLKTGVKKSPDKETLWYDLGVMYDKAGRFDDMVAAMREVLRLNPKNPGALNYLGYSFADRGVRLDEALSLLKQAVALKPGDGFITDSLGWAYYQRGDWDEALAQIQRAYALVPNEPTITEHMGDVWLKKNDRPKAVRYFREAVAILQKRAASGDAEAAKDLERVKKKLTDMGA